MTSFFKLLLEINDIEKSGAVIDYALLRDCITVTGRRVKQLQGFGTAKELRKWN